MKSINWYSAPGIEWAMVGWMTMCRWSRWMKFWIYTARDKLNISSSEVSSSFHCPSQCLQIELSALYWHLSLGPLTLCKIHAHETSVNSQQWQMIVCDSHDSIATVVWCMSFDMLTCSNMQRYGSLYDITKQSFCWVTVAMVTAIHFKDPDSFWGTRSPTGRVASQECLLESLWSLCWWHSDSGAVRKR